MRPADLDFCDCLPLKFEKIFLTKSSQIPVAVIVGASSGLGIAISKVFLEAGYQVYGVGRDAAKFEEASKAIASVKKPTASQCVHFLNCDATDQTAVHELFAHIQSCSGRLDVLVNCVGLSDRGSIESLSRERLIQLVDANVTSVLFCSQAALPMLKQSRGVVVNIGSLASKVGARYLGAYPAAKHALAGLSQQMRLEWKEYGVAVVLVNPGPIQREDAGIRYASQVSDAKIPAAARLPGGGTALTGLIPTMVAEKVLKAVQRRTPDLILPGYARLLVAAGHLYPRLGDWLLLKMTRK